MARGSHGERHIAVDGEYECDEVARDTQLEAFFQRTEKWFDVLQSSSPS